MRKFKILNFKFQIEMGKIFFRFGKLWQRADFPNLSESLSEKKKREFAEKF